MPYTATINLTAAGQLAITAGGTFTDLTASVYIDQAAEQIISSVMQPGVAAVLDLPPGTHDLHFDGSDMALVHSLIADKWPLTWFTPQLFASLKVLSLNGCGLSEPAASEVVTGMYNIAIAGSLNDGFLSLSGSSGPDQAASGLAAILKDQFGYNLLIDVIVSRAICKDVDVANMALAMISSSPIASMDEQSPEARKCKTFINQARCKTLEDGRFAAATKTATLQQITSSKPEYSYAYQLPANFLAVESLVPQEYGVIGGTITNWNITEGVLYCNTAVKLEYIADVDYQYLCANTIDAIATQLASRLIKPITGEDNQALLAAYHQIALPNAKSADALNRPSIADNSYQPWG